MMIRGLELLTYEEKPRGLGIFSLYKKVLWGNLVADYSIERGLMRKMERLFTRVCSDRTRCSGFRLKEGRFNVGH